MTIDLRAIRNTAGLTQAQLATAMNYGPGSRNPVGQIEGRQDWLLSSLANYLHGCGATAELVVKVAGEEFRFSVT